LPVWRGAGGLSHLAPLGFPQFAEAADFVLSRARRRRQKFPPAPNREL
jgi:hypothetical protein